MHCGGVKATGVCANAMNDFRLADVHGFTTKAASMQSAYYNQGTVYGHSMTSVNRQ